MTRLCLYLAMLTLLVGCSDETMRQPFVLSHSGIQALQRGDSVIVQYPHDSALCGPAVVFGIHYENDQLVWIEYADSTRVILHESFLWRKP